MKHTAAKLLLALCGTVVMLTFAAGITSVSVSALSDGIYLATATPHYRNPTTGIIEDSGGEGSAVLGQSMTESATYNKALVEIDPQGNTYITVRLQLMDNIKEPQFQVDGKAVTPTLMQEKYGSLSTENTADYRMKANSENSVIRCNMFVVAMGREVIFYITVSNLQAGQGDFIAGVRVEESKTTVYDEPPVSTDLPVTPGASETSATDPVTPGTSDSFSTDPVTPNTSDIPSGSTLSTTSDPITAPVTAPEKDVPETGITGLQEFDKDGNKVSGGNESKEAEREKSGSLIPWIAAGIVVIVIAGICVWYFAVCRKRNKREQGR